MTDEQADARRQAAKDYVDQDRFKNRFWSEKMQYENHFGHGFDAGVEWAMERILSDQNND